MNHLSVLVEYCRIYLDIFSYETSMTPSPLKLKIQIKTSKPYFSEFGTNSRQFLRILCTFHLGTGSETTMTSTVVWSDHASLLFHGIASLYKTGSLSDLVIKCHDQEFKVQKKRERRYQGIYSLFLGRY